MSGSESNTRVHVPVLLALTGLLYFTNLGGYALWPPDEPRFAEVTREMMMTGDYLVPRVNGEPYNEKPPLLFWSQAVVSLFFGGITETSARIPVALAGMMVVLLTYWVGRRMLGAETAFISALILATTQRFWWQARFAQIDMVLTLCLCVVFVLLWRWHEERKRSYLIGMYLAITAGLLAKGPPAILYPAFVIVTFYWGRKTDRKQLHWMIGFGAAILMALVWLIPARQAASVGEVVTASEGISQNLLKQTVGRFFSGVSHANPPWYYVVNLPLDLFPWSIFLPWTVVWFRRERPQHDAMRYLLAWIVPAFVFFTLCTEKRALYLLPMYPAIALLLGQSVVALGVREPGRWRSGTVLVWTGLLLLVGMAPWILLVTPYAEYWDNGLIALSAVGILGAAYGMALRKGEGVWPLVRSVALPGAAFLLAASTFVFPLVDQFKSAKEFCEPVRDSARSGADFELLMIEFSREEYVYYAEHFHEALPVGSWTDVPDGESDAGKWESFESNQIRLMRRSTEDVPVEGAGTWGEEEVRLLIDALDGMFEEMAEKREEIEGLREGIREVLKGRLLEMEKPMFVMVQDRDWRWIAPLLPELVEGYTVLRDEGVGSRHVLLLGNNAAVQLAEQTRG